MRQFQCLDLGADLFRHLLRAEQRGVGQDGGELLTAVARRQIAGAAGGILQHLGDLAQALVAGRVAIEIVVVFEAVDVGHAQRQRLSFAGGAAPLLFQLFVDAAGGDFHLRSGSVARGAGGALPSDVAAAIGVAAGTAVDLGSERDQTFLIDDGGEARIFGHDAFHDTRAIRRLVNRVSVEASFFKRMSPSENLSYPARFYGMTPRQTHSAIPAILERVGFPAQRRGEAMENLSRGMQQKVAIAAALNPDLLEQRIGRLDRIGQGDIVHIHVPYLENSPQSVLFHWYHEGLNAFEQTCPTGHSVFVQVEPALQEALHNPDADRANLPALLAATRELNQRLLDALHRGRDRLLEYSSCRPQRAETLTRRARAESAAGEAELLGYLEALFDAFGVEQEEHSEHAFIIRPGVQMQAPFPALPEDGLTFTCRRDIALANEDMEFITWEHPLVQGGMEMVLSGEQGNTAIVSLKHPRFRPGSLLLECDYVLESASTRAVQSARYLPPASIRVVVDLKGGDHTGVLPDTLLADHGAPVEIDTARKIVRAYRQPLRELLQLGETAARGRVPELLAQASQRIRRTLDPEIDRLRALGRVNPNVREAELLYLERQRDAAERAIASATLRLDAQRLIVTT